ncbi:MAG: hypothetical protein NTX82_01720 [Candidatus Parcubacteria bacterium]|nr:hypothetical protein [Candidatus Parcubacteria bacterium]
MARKILTICDLFLILAILLNLNWLKSPYLGAVLSLSYLLIFGYLLGKLIFPGQEKSWKIIIGTFSLLSAYSLLGAIIYFFYRLDQIVVSLIFIVISGIIVYLNYSKPLNSTPNFQNFQLTSYILNLKSYLKSLPLTLTYLILVTVSIFILFTHTTIDAIKSPWQVIPSAFFIIYFLATFNLIFLLYKFKNFLTYYLIFLHFFITTTIALFIYRLGFGFDPFIHQATELAIFKQGFILPKPFYYLGQYSLVITLSYLFQISVEWIDKLLLPLLLAIFLPFTMATTFIKSFNWQKNLAWILSLGFLIITFELFIATTPQALANLFAIIILFLSFLYLKDRQIPFWYLGILALTTLSIHALSGIPILIYLILIKLNEKKNLVTRIIFPVFSILACLALPLALFINSLISIYSVNFNWQNFNLLTWPTIFSRQFNYFLDLTYLYKYSIHWLLLILTLLTLYAVIKRRLLPYFLPSLLTFLILIANAIFLNFTKISLIIDYEQGEFSRRIFQLAFYFLLPIIIYGLYLILDKLKSQTFIYQSFFIVILSLAITMSLYLSYPRFDDYDNSKFINVSLADFQTVNFIDQNSQGKDYIVLANQMTSAAAVKTFGFTKYYNGQYFYPIPTGEELYKYFETMIYQTPDKQTVVQAMDKTGVKVAYFILPSYWSRYSLITEEAKKYADAIYNLDDKVIIFKYFK